jgi:hypothetical protein
MKSAIFSCFLLVMAGVTPLWSQQAIEPVRVRFLSFESDLNDLFHKVEREYVPLKIDAFSPGDYVDLGNSRQVELFRSVAKNDAAARPEWVSVLNETLPGEGKNFTVVVIPAAPGKVATSLRCIILNDDDPAYANGSIRFLNLSPYRVQGRVGQASFSVESGNSRMLSSPVLDAKGRAFMELQSNAEGPMKVFGRGPVMLGAHRRATIIAAFSSTLAESLQLTDRIGPDGKTLPEMMVATWRDDPPGQQKAPEGNLSPENL